MLDENTLKALKREYSSDSIFIEIKPFIEDYNILVVELLDDLPFLLQGIGKASLVKIKKEQTRFLKKEIMKIIVEKETEKTLLTDSYEKVFNEQYTKENLLSDLKEIKDSKELTASFQEFFLFKKDIIRQQREYREKIKKLESELKQ